MTEIEFRPIKKFVILDEMKYGSVEDLYADAITGMPPDVPIRLLWADGVVFVPLVIPPESEEIVKSRIQGTVYWGHVGYAKMDRYEGEISFGMHTIKITKTTSPALIDVVKKLKERL